MRSSVSFFASAGSTKRVSESELPTQRQIQFLQKSNWYPYNTAVYHLHHKRRNHKYETRYRSLQRLQCILIPLHISLYSSLLCHLHLYVDLCILLHLHVKRVSKGWVLSSIQPTQQKRLWPLIEKVSQWAVFFSTHPMFSDFPHVLPTVIQKISPR